MAMKSRKWQRIENGGLTFTELGFGAAPLGNLYRAIGDDEAQDILEKGVVRANWLEPGRGVP